MEFERQWEHIVDLLCIAASDISFCHDSSTSEVMKEEEREDKSHHSNASQEKTSACTLVIDR